MTSPIVGVVMGSQSDWDTMQHATQILHQFGIPHEARVVSAHRMPDDMFEYAQSAGARGLRCIIAGAGGAAHLPGMLAAKTPVPVLGVPVESHGGEYVEGSGGYRFRATIDSTGDVELKFIRLAIW